MSWRAASKERFGPDGELLSGAGDPRGTARLGSDSLAGLLGERYQVLARLGSGAFGEVYRAHDRVLGREVAIKRIRLDAFVEPQQLLEVEHRLVQGGAGRGAPAAPGIVTTHDIVSSAGASFIVMEYVAGRTLESLLEERKRLGIEETLRLLAQVAARSTTRTPRASSTATSSPPTSWSSRRGTSKVMDFGIAKIESGSNLTATGAIMGTPNYMSPEQARGEPVDARSDLFSLGCVLYECLTGSAAVPAPRASPAILVQVVTEDPPPVDFDGTRPAACVGAGAGPGDGQEPGGALRARVAEMMGVGGRGRKLGRPAAAVSMRDARRARPRGRRRAGRRFAQSRLRWKPLAAALPGALALGLLAWIARRPASAALPGSPGALVVQEPQGILDRLLRRPPRVRVTIPEGTWLRLALETPVSSETAVERASRSRPSPRARFVSAGWRRCQGDTASRAGRPRGVGGARRGRGELTHRLRVAGARGRDGRGADDAAHDARSGPAPRRRTVRAATRCLGAVGGLIDRIKGRAGSTEGGSAGAVAEARPTAAGDRAARGRGLAVELATAVTVRRTRSEPATVAE